MSQIAHNTPVVTESKLQEFYEQIKPYLGYIAEQIQYAEVPEPAMSIEDKVIQYIGDTDQNYINGRFYKCIYDSENEEYVWTELELVGQSGHEIQDSDGTDLTFRSIMQFAGDLETTDDSVNDKTVITPHALTNNDMAEIMSTLPGQRANGIKYSTTEQVIGQWIDGKPLYQKTIISTTTATSASSKVIETFTDIDTFVGAEGKYLHGGGYWCMIPEYVNANEYVGVFTFNPSTNALTVYTVSTGGARLNKNLIVTVQYTKTTDIIGE